MSLPKPDLHIRISDDAKSALRLLAEASEQPESALAARYLEECLLGRAHALKVAARRAYRAGALGIGRDEEPPR